MQSYEKLRGWKIYQKVLPLILFLKTAILQLQKTIDNKIQIFGSRANNAQKVILYLCERPAIDPPKISEITSLSLTSAYKLKSDLERLGIITESSKGIKGKYYIFKEYLELFR